MSKLLLSNNAVNWHSYESSICYKNVQKFKDGGIFICTNVYVPVAWTLILAHIFTLFLYNHQGSTVPLFWWMTRPKTTVLLILIKIVQMTLNLQRRIELSLINIQWLQANKEDTIVNKATWNLHTTKPTSITTSTSTSTVPHIHLFKRLKNTLPWRIHKR